MGSPRSGSVICCFHTLTALLGACSLLADRLQEGCRQPVSAQSSLTPLQRHTKPLSPCNSTQTHLAAHVARECAPQTNHGRGPTLTCGMPSPYLLPGTGCFICSRWLLAMPAAMADRFAPWLDGQAGHGGCLRASAPSSQERSAGSYPFCGCPLRALVR